MLTQCPECELPVSDKATACPHCGYPMKPSEKQKKPRKSNKRRRLPNGFGQISEIKNRNLRNPFRAMVTVGKTPDGKPICKPLKPESYFATYNDAYAALVEYNKNPYDLEPSITMQELYDKWLPEYEKTVKSTKSATSAWAYCSGVYKMRVMDIRARHVKGCMEEGVAVIRGKEQHPTATMKNQIKSLFNLMLDYALEYELVDRNYSRTFNLTEETVKEIQSVKKEHIAFADEEMDLLWANITNKRGIDMLLWVAPSRAWFIGTERCGLGELDFPGRHEDGRQREPHRPYPLPHSRPGAPKISGGGGTRQPLSAQLGRHQ